MVGSSTKMPMIHEAIKLASGKEPKIDKDPKLMVAKGAAIWGHWIKTGQISSLQKAANVQETSGLADLEAPNVVGRTAHGLGLLATRGKRAEAANFNDEQEQLEAVVSVLIGQNTATPCSYEKTFYTNQDNETSISVPLYEGESEDPKECSRIGHIVMDGLPPRPKHQPIKVKFNIDTSGLLEVEMTDVETGRKVLKRLEKNILRGNSQETEIDLEARRRHLDTLEVV
jgi:molecular chaperone DnaK